MNLPTFIVCVILFVGCVNPFAPKLDESPNNSTSILSDQKTVDGVLQNFKQAYIFRDTTIYGRLFAQNFIFVFKDYEKGVDVFWGRDDDVRTTYGLFQNVQRLDLIWNSTVATSGDNIKLTITKNFNLTVTFSASDVVRIDGYANLTLERTDSTTAWLITRWRDESNF